MSKSLGIPHPNINLQLGHLRTCCSIVDGPVWWSDRKSKEKLQRAQEDMSRNREALSCSLLMKYSLSQAELIRIQRLTVLSKALYALGAAKDHLTCFAPEDAIKLKETEANHLRNTNGSC